jgi:hypothetical protein
MGNATFKVPLQNKPGVMVIASSVTQDARQAGQGRIVKQQQTAKERMFHLQKSVMLKAVKQAGKVMIARQLHTLLMRKK